MRIRLQRLTLTTHRRTSEFKTDQLLVRASNPDRHTGTRHVHSGFSCSQTSGSTARLTSAGDSDSFFCAPNIGQCLTNSNDSVNCLTVYSFIGNRRILPQSQTYLAFGPGKCPIFFVQALSAITTPSPGLETDPKVQWARFRSSYCFLPVQCLIPLLNDFWP
ncbi:hypothetical protein BDY19DRAFT_628398 [Irpex rosettiformis]|uniref:Uncharacterized protein n=1 Tax=Irpex rosettiformis TaxID=378272 RepID=A0ACB8UB48_9APHY|nr:hypothetical protein BDY19DRAFT_628398 [Irpex rosettiformis]